ncbi:recombination endonuclease subunit [Salmonella phage bering]|uniref:Recombination endonuclease subunit n=1 Tax=Salmonella phage bering TaxID=2713281 RepID=A0A6G9LBA5_9CAUD|nr:recombination endonuclease subunit [Salmonella phage bering]QIQ61946.1 recombination endonuclease subunit [Salmonella phage bering]
MSNVDLLSKFGSLLREADTPVSVEAPFEIRGEITHKLTFHRGRAKNFRSIGNEFMEIDYQRNPATLVTSDDNGAGKSTMLVWLLFFVLYNDTYSKKEKKAGLVNSQNKKECVGEVEFSTRGSEWKVRRGIKPDFVEVYQMVDGEWKQVVNDAAKADMNKYIVNLIGVDQKMFENSLVLGKEKFIPFTEMYTADRRAMVETIWDLGFFSLMNEDVKASIKTVTNELTTVTNDYAFHDVNLKGQQAQLEQINNSNAMIQQQSADILVQEKERLNSLNSDIGAVQEQLTESRAQNSKLESELSEVRNRLNAEMKGDIDAINEEYAAKIQAVQDEADTKAEDYERIEVSDGERSLQEIRERMAVVAERKNELVGQRNANLDELNKALARRQQGENFRFKFVTEMEGHESAIKRFHEMGTCPTCTQLVSDDTKSRIESQYYPQISELQDKILQVDTALEEVNSLIENYNVKDSELSSQVSVVDKELESIRNEAREAETAIAALKRDIQGFYEVAAVEKASLQREQQSKVNDILRAVDVRYEDITTSIRQAREQLSKSINDTADKLTSMKSRRAPLEASIADLERKLSIKPTPTDALEEEITRITELMDGLNTRRVELDEKLQDLNHLLFFLKDDQTKARIISLYLPFLNSKINEYLEALNMFLDIAVDDTFEITMSAAGRKGQSIFSLSTGQRSRLNLAVTLALRDVANLKASVQCNLFVLDEILENMSERGVQESVEMLKHKFGGNNLFVISQREQEFQEYFQHNIRYGLRNGMTEVIKKD